MEAGAGAGEWVGESAGPRLAPLGRRRLGALPVEVCPLGLGGAWLGRVPGADAEAQDRAAVEAVHAAIRLGMDYLDTSPLYGESERRVGLALAEPHPEGGAWRDRVFLVTKAGTHPLRRGDYSAEAIRWSVESSLRRLRTDRLDAVLVHDPVEMLPVLAPGGAAEALTRLREEGRVGALGIGVHRHAHLLAAVRDGRFQIIQTTYDYSLIRTSALEQVVPEAAARGLALINASPFHGGLLAAGTERRLEEIERIRDWRSRPADLERARQLYRWAAARGADLAALAMQFSLREPRFAVTLVGPRTRAEVEDGVRAALASVSPDTWRALLGLLPTLSSPAPGGESDP